MRLRGLYIHLEIEKISIFLCQKVTRICVLTRVVLTNARKLLLLLIDFRRFSAYNIPLWSIVREIRLFMGNIT